MASNDMKNATINQKRAVDGRGIEWDERTTGGAGGARLDCFGGNRVGRVGET